MSMRPVLALSALLLCPPAADAQIDYWWGPTLRITPFLAVSPAFDQDGEATVFASDGSVLVHDVFTRFNSGFGLGIAAEYRVWDAFTIIASGMWSGRDDGFLFDAEDSLNYEVDGSNFWLFKAGLALQLREDDEDDLLLDRPYAHIYVAPALLIDDPTSEPVTSGAARRSGRHPALNMGATAELPFWNQRVSFVITAEDYLVFWDDDQVQNRAVAALQRGYPGSTVIVTAGESHVWFFRFGIGLRM